MAEGYELYLGPEDDETWWLLLDGKKIGGPYPDANACNDAAKKHFAAVDMANIFAQYDVGRIVR